MPLRLRLGKAGALQLRRARGVVRVLKLFEDDVQGVVETCGLARCLKLPALQWPGALPGFMGHGRAAGLLDLGVAVDGDVAEWAPRLRVGRHGAGDRALAVLRVFRRRGRLADSLPRRLDVLKDLEGSLVLGPRHQALLRRLPPALAVEAQGLVLAGAGAATGVSASVALCSGWGQQGLSQPIPVDLHGEVALAVWLQVQPPLQLQVRRTLAAGNFQG
mmetsp:Transcript_32460/g.103033  ORF Transcript_32460/g.103033 Transcript_32460/m.103033 type:complete len:218 (-) Transcript_32460:312-965(-)